MMDGLWANSMTWKSRYDDFGVTGYMLRHARHMEKTAVFDVGYSKGVAVTESKKCLQNTELNFTQ